MHQLKLGENNSEDGFNEKYRIFMHSKKNIIFCTVKKVSYLVVRKYFISCTK